MEMRAIEDVAIGEDLTPPLPSLASVLHDSALCSYCSACFSTLPPHPFHPYAPTFPRNSLHVPSDTPAPLYCSSNCSSIDSPLHFSSAEPHILSLFTDTPPSTWTDSTDLRLALRLLYIFQNLPPKFRIWPRFTGPMSRDQGVFVGGKRDHPFQETENNEGPDYHLGNGDDPMENMERVAGLMTNREKFIFGEIVDNPFQGGEENRGNCEDSCENTENVAERIKEGAKMMAKARRMCVSEDENVYEEEMFVLEVMVLCLVMTNAVEVQDKSGCSIGIAVYDTTFSWINHSCSPNACYRFLLEQDCKEQPPLRISPAADGGCVNGDGNGLIMEGDSKYPFSERNGYGPRVIVRSIKAVNKGEDVTIAYTDLLQPKEMRQAELWSKYRFSCTCRRCAAVPTTYVDYALKALSAFDPDSDNEIEKLMQKFDNAISDYLSFNDPKSCCNKLENLLSHGDLNDEFLEPKEVKSPPHKIKLHPLHHLSLNAYTTLASAYKVQASDQRHKHEAFNMLKTSSAYSLLQAGVAHHLLTFESALVTTVSNFWTYAGESLLNLARSPLCNSFFKQGLIHLESSSFMNLKCNDCCFADSLDPIYHRSDQNLELEETKSRLYTCIASITPKLWRSLSSESSFLKSIQNPVDLSWLAYPATSRTPEGYSQLEAEESNDQLQMNLFLLSMHCLRYGALLSSICYGLSAELNYNRTPEILEEPVKFFTF